MAIRRSPFVESKSRTHEEIYADGHLTIDPTDWNSIPNVDADGDVQTVVNLPVWSINSQQLFSDIVE